MYCNCKQKEIYIQEIDKRQQSIQILQEMLKRQKDAHLTQIMRINKEIKLFVEEKQTEIQRMGQLNTRLRIKVQNYKEKIHKLNQKYQECNSLIKDLNQRQNSLEQEVALQRAKNKIKRQKQIQSNDCLDQAKEIIHLQELQISQLKRQLSKNQAQIQHLEQQNSRIANIKQHLKEFQQISIENQKSQFLTLKQKFLADFDYSTNQILKQIEQANIKPISQTINDEIKRLKIKESFQYEQDMTKLYKHTQYGTFFFEVDTKFLTSQAKDIFMFMKQLSESRDQYALELDNYKNKVCEMIQESSAKTSELERVLEEITKNKQNYNSIGTQTTQSFKIKEIIDVNYFLKFKIHTFSSLLSKFSSFIIFLIKILQSNHNKQNYFYLTQNIFFSVANKKNSKKRTLKSVVRAILFIERLKTKMKKKNRMLKQNKWSKLSIEERIKDEHLSHLLVLFLNSRKNIQKRNICIEQIFKEKSQKNIDIRMLEILNEQSIQDRNEGFLRKDLFSVFIFCMKQKLNPLT